MRAKCIKQDKRGLFKVGKCYEVRKSRSDFGTFDVYYVYYDGWATAICEDIFKEIFEMVDKTPEQPLFHFDPNRPFEERCEIVRQTPLTPEMTYKERLKTLRRRYGL